MQIIMGIDQSLTSTGVAVMEYIPHGGSGQGIIELMHTEAIQTKPTGHDDWVVDIKQRAEFIGDRLIEIIEEYRPNEIAFEAPSLGSSGSASRSLPMLFGMLLTRVTAYMNEREAVLTTVPPTSLKKFATGNGGAKKDRMVDAIMDNHTELYCKLNDTPKSRGRYDIADAYWLTQWVIKEGNR